MIQIEILIVKFSIPEPVRNTFWSFDIRIFPLYILTPFHPLFPVEDMGHGQQRNGVMEQVPNY